MADGDKVCGAVCLSLQRDAHSVLLNQGRLLASQVRERRETADDVGGRKRRMRILTIKVIKSYHIFQSRADMAPSIPQSSPPTPPSPAVS